MIERITIDNFKSLKKVDLKLGRLNLFVGANASGKSNLFDALQVLWGIANGNPLKEFLEGGSGTNSGERWPGIRGGLANAIYRPPPTRAPSSPAEQAKPNHSTFAELMSNATAHPTREATLRVRLTEPSGSLEYSFTFDSGGETTDEWLMKAGTKVASMEGGEVLFRHADKPLSPGVPNPWGGSEIIHSLSVGALAGDKDMITLISHLMGQLTSMQFLELEPRVLRQYGLAADVPRPMGRSGENFAGVVRSICADPKTKAAYLSWLQELRPQEVDDVKTLNGALGEPLFALSEGGQDFPAPVLSDGTLRFAALAASFFRHPPPLLLAVEEIENGIHGSRLRLLVELFRRQAAFGQIQVLATTHSPLVLAWLKPEEYQNTFVCKRDEMTGESRILPLTEIPRFEEVIRTQSITELLTEGWMEAAL
ncbi:MAG: AAA family ATPase [Verrucomicrobiota bacterium]|jgi:energy-coupling factor transporter ATP-binding protein EcfA2